LHGCKRIAVESTGNYWYPIYIVLEDSIEFVLANAYQVKNIDGKKTDKIDSERLAKYCLNNLISPSRIYPKDYRDLRSLTRSRETLVNMSTRIKNQIHQNLEASCIKISSVLSDIFGKSGRYILDRLLEGKTIDQIISGIPSKRIRRKADQLREAILASIDPVQIFLIKSNLEILDNLNKTIEALNIEISEMVKLFEEDFKIILSMPGMGVVSASTILAEIGDYRDFKTPEKMAKYFGIVPWVYQSAGKLKTGHITKTGSKHLRRMIVEVAHAVARSKRDSPLKRFYLRIRNRKGAKVAIVALARKMLCILHHLLLNREEYQDQGPMIKRRRPIPAGYASPLSEMDLDEMMRILVQAGRLAKEDLKDGCG
jgi:transposase